MTTVDYVGDRHYNVRKHEIVTVAVPVEMLTDPVYFDADGRPTTEFDEWACQNGTFSAESVELLDDEELFYQYDPELVPGETDLSVSGNS